MPKFRVRGTYTITHFIDFDEIVDGDTEEFAVDMAGEVARFRAKHATTDICEWLDNGPEVVEQS